MKIIDWLNGLFRPPEPGIYRLESYRAEAEEHAAIDAFALFTAVHLISNLLSGCEFRTYRNGVELRGAEWYSMNVKPNRNQNAVEWKREFISRLLLAGEVLCIQLA
ncbi:MAG: phage portal protein, partial [Oscillospiraceae bacterium]|nr:phage portal protein [Oscillospiraceae bacterium]